MRPAPLPRGAGQHRGDRVHQPRVVVAGHQGDAGQAAGGQAAQERQPPRAVLGAGHVDAEDLPAPAGVHAGRDQAVHADGTAALVDFLGQKVHEGGRTVSVHCLIATGVNAGGCREILGIDVTSSEDGAGWLAFLRGLAARGLSGVALVTSDDHAGLVNAIAAVLPGAAWQRCRTHYHRNLLTRVPKSAQPWVSTLVRTIFEQPDPASVRAQHAQVTAALEAKFPAAAAHLDDAREDILAFTAFPREVWRQIWSNNPQERLNKEVRRRTDVVGIFPGRDAIIRLVGAVLAEQNDEWTESRRYMGLEILAACRKAGQLDMGQNATSEAELTIGAIPAYYPIHGFVDYIAFA